MQFQERFSLLNTNFDRMNKKYVKSLGFLTRKKWIVVVALLCFLDCRFSFQITPSGFIPNEDRNHICRRRTPGPP
jgi:HAE1 family hydrophobic/amphiphilic exporter-1